MAFHSLNAIRKYTRPLHRELETLVPLNQLTSRTLKKTDYEHALFILYQWYTLIEPCIQAGLPAQIKRECAFESALPYLIEDLSQKSMPVYHGKPKVLHQSVNWSLGASYVVLSSSSQSRLILDNLNDINAHISTLWPTNFYRFHFRRADSWLTYQHCLAEQEQAPNFSEDEVVEGAVEGFKLLRTITEDVEMQVFA